jgi:Fe2+ transport system protein FeoA
MMIDTYTDTMIWTLADVPSHHFVRVLHIEAATNAKMRLNQLGIHTGEILFVKGGAAFQGPILIKIHSSQIAIPRSMAAKIKVQLIKSRME